MKREHCHFTGAELLPLYPKLVEEENEKGSAIHKPFQLLEALRFKKENKAAGKKMLNAVYLLPFSSLIGPQLYPDWPPAWFKTTFPSLP